MGAAIFKYEKNCNREIQDAGKPQKNFLKLEQPYLYTTDWRSIESIGKTPTRVSGKQHLSGRIHITKSYVLLIKNYKGIIEKSVSATITIIKRHMRVCYIGIIIYLAHTLENILSPRKTEIRLKKTILNL